MTATFWCDVAANWVGGLAAGVPVALLAAFLAWRVGRRLNWFQVQEEQRERERREADRAIQWLELLAGEVSYLEKLMPQWRDAVQSKEWGRVFIIWTQFWDLAVQSGELGRLATPRLLRRLARLYEGLRHAEAWVGVLGQSWMADDSRVASARAKRKAFIGLAVQGLDQAQKAADGLGEQLEAEIKRLRRRLKELGGHVPGDAER